MTTSLVVNEGSTAYLTVSFYDRTGAAVSPASVTWEAHDSDSGTELQAATALTPATSIVITIPSAVNVIQNTNHKSELRVVTIKATLGDGSKMNEEAEYQVRNLKHT